METTSKRKSGTTDLTVGKPLFQILRFALPLVLGTLFQQLYSFADTVIVGRCLGTDALGAVGTTYSLNFLILGFVQGACVGFGIPVAETFGAKDKGGLRKYLFNGALLCVVLSVVFTLFTTLMAGPLLQLIHTPEELYADAVLYIRIIFLGIPATVLYNYASSVLRAMGDSQHPFYFLLAILHSLAGAVRGTGKSVPPMVVLLLSLCLFRVAWIQFILPFFHSIEGVFVLYPVSWGLGAVLMVLYTWRANWMEHAA